MARPEPASRTAPSTEPPPVDPTDAVRSAYSFHRAKRRVRHERRRQTRQAGMRFAITLAVLVFIAVVLSLTVWNEIQRLFGL
jgi:hypothetical protein